MHELVDRRGDRRRSPCGTPRAAVSRASRCRSATCARWCPSALEFAFELVAQGTAAGGRRAGDRGGAGDAGAAAACGARDDVRRRSRCACAACGGAGRGGDAAARSCCVEALELEDERLATREAGHGSTLKPQPTGVEEVHILWISEGMSCDGDSVSVTAAGQPAHRGRAARRDPRAARRSTCTTRCSSPTLGGEEFLHAVPPGGRRRARRAVRARHRGLDPQREHQRRGLLDVVRQRPGHRRAADAQLVARPARARRRGASSPIGTCATYGGIHAMAGNPTGCMGLADYLGWDFRSAGGLPIVNVPGCPVQPENFMETLTWLLYQAAGLAPVIPLDEPAAPAVALRQDRPRGLRPRRLLRAGRLRHGLQLAQVPGEDRLLGAGRQLQRAQARLDGRHRRLPERRRHLHRLHDARLPRQVHAVHGRAARRRRCRRRSAAPTGR